MLGRDVKIHSVFVRLFCLLMLIFHFWLSSAFSNVWRGCQSQQRLTTNFSSLKVAPVMFVRTSFTKAWKSSEQTRLTDKRLSSLITIGNFQTCVIVTATSVTSAHNSTFVRDNFWGTLKRLKICHFSGNYFVAEWQQCITDKTLTCVGGTEPVVHWKLAFDTLLGPEPPVADHWTLLHNPTLVNICLSQIPLACV